MTKISEMDIENIIELELSELHMPLKPTKAQKVGNQLLVTGLPIVPLSKIDQLKKYIKTKMKCDDVHIPMDFTNQSKGFIFVRFPTDEMAQMTHKQFNGMPFDKSHVFNIIMLSEYSQLMQEEEKFTESQGAVWRYQNDMSSWLLQRQCRDQLLVHSKSDINIYEHSGRNLETKWSKSDFTDSIVMWSPLGSYMATIHDLGVALWGGSNFVQINRFKHSKVRHAVFSPNEKYLLTYSLSNTTYVVNVWEVLTGTILREFIIQKSEDETNQSWPEFRWSFDDQYFARKQKDKISVYLSENCGMVDKKSIDIVGLKDFTWSARGHLISFWVGEQESAPARIVLISLPTKKEVFTKTLFNVTDISLKWSSQDDYLAVISERYVKKKLVENQYKYIGLTASLEIYRIKEKEIPVEKIVISDKNQIVANDWEINGSKFALLTFNQKTTSILIYDLKIAGQVQKIMDHCFLTRMTVLKWSPTGQFIACTAPNSSIIEFIDGHDGNVLKRVETNNLNDMAWDPTGRYLLSYRLSLLSDVAECGASFYSITGKLMMEKSMPGLKQIMWRPRPPCLLSDHEIKLIKKNMNKYSTQFANQDEMMTNETKRKLMEHRHKMIADWTAIKNRIHAHYNSEKEVRTNLRKNVDTDNLEHGKYKEQDYVLVSSKVVALPA